MRNRVTHHIRQTQANANSGRLHTDAHPGQRIGVLFCATVLGLSVVTLRLGHLQVGMSEEYQAQFDRKIEKFEPIPSRHGRILSADGRVLAQDVERFRIKVHYRWLEDPPDNRWLRQQALSRLTRLQRRDNARVDREEQRVRDQRDRLWRNFAEVTGVGTQRLNTQRERIQQRVERIVRDVDQRRDQRRQQRKLTSAAARDSAKRPGVWQTVVDALTTPPQRARLDPIIVAEQQDYHTMISETDLKTTATIKAHPDRFPITALKIELATRREYPYGRLAAHVIGYRTLIDEKTLNDRRSRFGNQDPLVYLADDRVGRSGVERSYERVLRGLPGRRRLVKNRRGEILFAETVREPRVGQDIVLTIDAALQAECEEVMRDVLAGPKTPQDEHAEKGTTETQLVPQGGVLVALDVRTGAVLTAVSAPGFNLESVVRGDTRAWKALMSDPRQPFFPRVTRMTIPPGSVFKPLTAAALLEHDIVDPYQNFFCQGYLSDPAHHRCLVFRRYGVGHFDVDLPMAIARSCNVYFYSGARKLGASRLVDWARRMGFGDPTGIDLPGEHGGHLPSPGEYTSRNERWHTSDTLALAIGQSSLTVTPLQIARMMAVVASGGYLVTPHVVRGTGPVLVSGDADEAGLPDLRHSESTEPQRIPGLSDETIERIHEGLVNVVEHPRGTGYKHVRLDEITIAGKTGTAEVGGGKPDHAWFAGYVPAERPRIAFAVVLEHAGSGGKVAGPVARKLVQALIKHGYVRPTIATAPDKTGG